MAWLQLTIETTVQHAEAVSDVLSEAGALAVTLQDAADQPLFEPEPETTPLWDKVRVVGLFDAEHDMQAVCKQLTQYRPYRLEPLEDKDWNRAWMEHFHPMRFGEHVWICPSWCEPPDPKAVNILLDPGLAFGTGTHPTTALCLTWLDAHPPRHQRVIDYGCGSGILAIAALKLGAEHVLAIDHDPQALTATQDNAMRNQIAPEALTVSLPIPHPAPLPEGEGEEPSVDYLLANILAQPLLDLAPLFATLVRPNGKIVLSGILETQVDAVRSRYQTWFDMGYLETLEGWACLSGIRKKGVFMPVSKSIKSLHENVLHVLQTYFDQMGDHEITGMYDMVLKEVEIPLLKTVLKQAKGNQSKAAEMLGLNRSTLRKKLKQYKLL
jgi:ribosomal protein L11 methyltransferase